ncbi:valine--tRNA ligase [Limibacillus halophilus]|uniref:Valine--tRNA ligase n=1 Tax=Limibacillus halophilus TaxID=1579333 RepID=A0A839SUZ1_9PROT|nr:valine--tRNA ligase [Limibacillus halophilus]MBB3065534.1 valyl-tRNA synthetase [Limibacillus halophilus]
MLEKTYRPKEVETKNYARWEEAGCFEAHEDSAQPPYTIMMPPANVTGSLHIGHALTFSIQDILIRWKRMRGHDALWQPGTDHAGIATQMVVERNLAAEGIHRRDLGRDKFLEKVWNWKEESGGTIIRQLRHLGASADWKRERFTMDEGLSKAVVKVFVELYKQGLIYRDKRLVNWDPKLHTAISDLEVQQKETKGHLWHFRYPIEGEDGRYIVVATTRPETMLGDSGVAVHPEDERYADLIGKFVVLPLVGRRIPIVADEWADPETGSGAVKITPAHDFNDFEVGRRHELEMINIFDQDAHLNDSVPEPYRRLDRFEARARVVADLEALGLVDKIEDHVHVVPHGDRGGVPIEPYLTDQWYVDAATLAKPCIEAVESGKTRFVPQQYENIYFDWMRNIQPWCVSRQIWWGHQIPAWYGPDGTVFVEMTEEAASASAKSHYGKTVDLRRDEDVLDTWFSSALWPFSTLGWPEDTAAVERYYPGDVLVTGFDIIFFWVARMMMMGIHFMGEVPFKDVYIHGLVRDAEGQKMSKSKGNTMDPLDVVEKYGCDALRFTLAALCTNGRDIKLAEPRIEGYRNFATKLWNASRFALMNGVELQAGYDPSTNSLTINRWIVSKLTSAASSLDQALSSYRFNDAASILYHFAWGEFCDWYIELSKPILNGEDLVAKAETQATTAWVLTQIVKLMHPLMPYITEELWGTLSGGGEGLLISAAWPALPETLTDVEAEAEIDWLIKLITEVRGTRNQMNVPAAAQVPLLIKGASDITRARLTANEALIGRLARVSKLTHSETSAGEGDVQMVVGEATFVMPLGDVIDLAAERARLQRDLSKLEGEIAKIEKKLANEQFIAKAPEEVVEEQRERLVEASQTRQKLSDAVARLGA